MSSIHGSRRWGAVIMWIIKCSLYTAAADKGCYHVNYKCSLPTAAADEGLLSCEWEVIPYTRQPLMRGYYHVNERLSRSHSSHWWGAGILWMSEELSDCALHSRTPLCGGAACWHSGFFRAASAATWDPFAPASAFGSPHRHGMGAWEARLMSCPAGSTVRGIRTFSWHKLITRVPKVHRWSEGRRTTFKKCHTHLNAAEAAMRPALEWANLNREL